MFIARRSPLNPKAPKERYEYSLLRSSLTEASSPINISCLRHEAVLRLLLIHSSGPINLRMHRVPFRRLLEGERDAQR